MKGGTTSGGVSFGAVQPSESRSRSNSEAGGEESLAPPQPSPGVLSSKHASVDRITSSAGSSTAANTSANSSSTGSGRMNFGGAGAARVLDEHLSAQQFAFLPENKLIFTCGHWDHSCRITNAETGNLVQSVRQHRDVITCLALARDFGQRWLVTGSRDCTLMVWDVSTDRELPLKTQPQYILYGHDDSITCVAINTELDVVVSGSDDGTVIIHNLRDGTYVRSIVDSGRSAGLGRPMSAADVEENMVGELLDSNGRRCSLRPSSAAVLSGSPTHGSGGSSNVVLRKVSWVGISKEAYVVTYSADDQMLCTYSLNGLLISSRAVPESLYAFMLSEDGKVLITGGSSCLVVFRWVSIIFSALYIFVLCQILRAICPVAVELCRHISLQSCSYA